MFTDDDVPVYADKENTTLKTSQDDNGNLIFYESVRTQAAMASISMEDGHRGEIVALVGGLGEKKVDRGTNRAHAAPPDRFHHEAHCCLLPGSGQQDHQLFFAHGGYAVLPQERPSGAGYRPLPEAWPFY